MQWVSENIGLVIQAAITVAGSSVAIWIALFQQRAIGRREEQTIRQKQQSVAYVIMRDVMDTVVKVTANLIHVQQTKEANPDIDENTLLNGTQVELPAALVLDFDTAQFIGSTLARDLVVIQNSVVIFNYTRTISERLLAYNDLLRRIQGMDKEWAKLLPKSA